MVMETFEETQAKVQSRVKLSGTSIEVYSPGSPILFLDFDGVLNNKNHMESFPGRYLMKQPFDLYNVEIFINLCKFLVEYRIVISSAWRNFGFYDGYLYSLLREYGISNIVGETPPPPSGGSYGIRGIEIHSWLVNNGEQDTPFVILDDQDNMGWLVSNLIQTDKDRGLQREDMFLVLDYIRDYDEHMSTTHWSNEDDHWPGMGKRYLTTACKIEQPALWVGALEGITCEKCKKLARKFYNV
jgi:hypothetical protein